MANVALLSSGIDLKWMEADLTPPSVMKLNYEKPKALMFTIIGTVAVVAA